MALQNSHWLCVCMAVDVEAGLCFDMDTEMRGCD